MLFVRINSIYTEKIGNVRNFSAYHNGRAGTTGGWGPVTAPAAPRTPFGPGDELLCAVVDLGELPL